MYYRVLLFIVTVSARNFDYVIVDRVPGSYSDVRHNTDTRNVNRERTADLTLKPDSYFEYKSRSDNPYDYISEKRNDVTPSSYSGHEFNNRENIRLTLNPSEIKPEYVDNGRNRDAEQIRRSYNAHTDINRYEARQPVIYPGQNNNNFDKNSGTKRFQQNYPEKREEFQGSYSHSKTNYTNDFQNRSQFERNNNTVPAPGMDFKHSQPDNYHHRNNDESNQPKRTNFAIMNATRNDYNGTHNYHKNITISNNTVKQNTNDRNMTNVVDYRHSYITKRLNDTKNSKNNKTFGYTLTYPNQTNRLPQKTELNYDRVINTTINMTYGSNITAIQNKLIPRKNHSRIDGEKQDTTVSNLGYVPEKMGPDEVTTEKKWVWNSIDDQNTTQTAITPITPDFDNRNAFDGDKCATGKVRVGSLCIPIDM